VGNGLATGPCGLPPGKVAGVSEPRTTEPAGSEPAPTEALAPDVRAVLTAVQEAGRTGANPTKLARAAASHLSDDDYEDLVLDLVERDLILASKGGRGAAAARYPTGITAKGRVALTGSDGSA